PQFARPGFHHADHAELAGGIVGLPEVAVDPHDRRGIQDHPGALLDHDPRHRLGAVIRALEVHVDYAIDLILAHLQQLRVLHDPRVVAQDVAPAITLHDCVNHGLNRSRYGDVDDEAVRLAAGMAHVFHCHVDGLLIEVADDDLGALARELQRGGVADAAP